VKVRAYASGTRPKVIEGEDIAKWIVIGLSIDIHTACSRVQDHDLVPNATGSVDLAVVPRADSTGQRGAIAHAWQNACRGRRILVWDLVLGHFARRGIQPDQSVDQEVLDVDHSIVAFADVARPGLWRGQIVEREV
jgi:hypothetical protein